ncbi:protein AATF [Bombus huntii]|uniref:protein AATF n=1 Tax=Bombus huntii TaxID=85661 RepID=UPI0021AAF1D2|nr:protein AATF [Bombus huntii]XP_050475465.1 protein AATF [Bombus huntii]XP_050475466.1 protein AATF [Bombus huntii]XP_050475467.1 protein AATF [Bombus huntii]
MALKAQKKTLADKVNSLVTTTPVTFNSDDEAEDTKAKLVDRYDESDNSDSNFQISEIRRRNVDLLDQVDERYKGKKVSRKDIYEDDDDEDSVVQSTSESEDEEMNSMEQESDDISNSNNEEDMEDDDSNMEDDENDHSNEEMSYDTKMNLEQDSENEDSKDIPSTKQGTDIKTISQINIRADIEKGSCVRNQLKLWENLLEMRIKLQKCLITSNQMPQHDVYQNFKMDAEYTKTADEVKNKLKILLNNMLQLQTFFLKQYPETKNLSMSNKKRKAEESTDEIANTEDPMDEEILSDTEDENEDKDTISDKYKESFNKNVFSKKLKLKDYEKILNDNHKSYIEYRNSVVQKWNEKTRITSGKLNKGMSETTLKQIEFALNDKEKLLKKSRLKRSEYKIVGKEQITEDSDGRRIQDYDSEIYDDDDFYHQLLRDLIEYKSSDITDPIQLSKQWIKLQNMRRKMKRKIDTRATKGRRIRYNVHNKLVNFMAPITISDTWTDHAKDELYSSLFGRIKPPNVQVGR